MEYIYVLDNIDCFNNMMRNVVIDNNVVEITNIYNTDKDVLNYDFNNEYCFIYSIPTDYKLSTIKTLTSCGLIVTLKIEDINDDYIAEQQKQAVIDYPNKILSHTDFTDMLYHILTTPSSIITIQSTDSITPIINNTDKATH